MAGTDALGQPTWADTDPVNLAVDLTAAADAVGHGPYQRGTAAQRAAALDPYPGLLWWQTDQGGGLWMHTGSGWESLSTPASIHEANEQGNSTVTRGASAGLIIGVSVSNPWPIPMPVLVELTATMSPSAGNNVAGYLFTQVNGEAFGQRRFSTASTGDTGTLWPIVFSRPMVLAPGSNTIHARASVDSLSSGSAVFSRRALSVQRIPRI